MNYTALLEEYTQTEARLRERTTALRQQAKQLPLVERDGVRRRLAVMEEELFDVALVGLELERRRKESGVTAAC